MTTPPALQHRIEQVLGKPLITIREIQRGYTPALRMVVTCADGSTAFVKAAVNDLTAEWLRKEQRMYATLAGSFMAEPLGWDDDGGQPILVLADLSDAFWPPPWSDQRIQQVREALDAVAHTPAPPLPALAEDDRVVHSWEQVAQDPAPFLSLGLASRRWLDAALPILLAIDSRQILAGESLVHFDVRSDNICFVEDRAILLDWNLACIGNPQFDTGFWLPSLEAEGGPPPEMILPDAPAIAGLVSGFFAARAGNPPIPDAPHVRSIQLVQLRSALPWAVRALDLPPLDWV